MGCMCSSPPTPDYGAAAAAQGAANKETAIAQANLNNPNTYTPYGNQIWTGGEDGSRPTLTSSLSPAEQVKLDLTNSIQRDALGQLEHWGGNNIAKALSTNFKPTGSAAMDFDPRFMPTQGIQTDSGMYSAAPQQEDVNLGAASAIPTADRATREAVTQGVYDQGARFLDPQFAQKADQMKADLSNQGIFSGSEAYNTEQDNFNRQKMQAYGDLSDRAIMQGGEEMARDFGMGMQAHQQGVNDIMQSGTFHNQARADMINQLLADMAARNSGITTSANIAAQGTGLFNQGRAQEANETAQGVMLPINAASAILTGSQVNNPNFQPYNNSTQVAPPPVFNAAVAQGQADQNAYNAQQATFGNFLGAAGNIGSAWLKS